MKKLIKHQKISKYYENVADVDSISTNVPLEEIIEICANTLFENRKKVEVLSKIEFKELLSLTAKESYFFNGKIYKQVDRVAMVSL